jgi:hypothetical protein
MGLPRSRAGWTSATIYLALASLLIYQAFTCSGWVCDVVEFPAVIPFGLLYFEILRWLDPVFVFGSITYAPFRNWFFIVPTLAGNGFVYYWVGVGVARLGSKLFRRVPV